MARAGPSVVGPLKGRVRDMGYERTAHVAEAVSPRENERIGARHGLHADHVDDPIQRYSIERGQKENNTG